MLLRRSRSGNRAFFPSRFIVSSSLTRRSEVELMADSFINPFEANYKCKICDGPMEIIGNVIFQCDICGKHQMQFFKFHHELSYNLDWEKITVGNFSYIWFAKVWELRLRKQMNPYPGGFLILETSSKKHFSSELIKTKLLPRLEMLNLFQ